MRIGIDMLAVQSPGSRGRGVGRYARQLTETLLQRGRRHEFVLYSHDGLPDDEVPGDGGAHRVVLRPDPARGESRLREVVDRVARANPDGLDVLLTLNPFELCPGYDPPPAPLSGPRVAAVLFDLIPFVFQEQYLDQPLHAAWMYRRLRGLRHYDAILAISEATRRDALRMLDLPGDRVTNISSAVDGTFFRPDRSLPMPEATKRLLSRLGVRGPFVFCLGGMDRRKNLAGLLEAFRLLPMPLRHAHQLVVACSLREEDERALRRRAESLGIGARVVLAGAVDDETLRELYRRCAAFVFPSLYEGFGLPILEAMHCGAAVVAGDNSSQPEVVGDAGLLANAADPGDLAAQLARLLGDAGLNRRLGEAAERRARGFSWDATADRALGAIERLGAAEPAGVEAGRHSRPYRERVGTSRVKPRVAVVSPWPPKGTGIADYAARLVEAMAEHYAIDLIHEPGYVPGPALRDAAHACHDARLLPRLLKIKGYHGLLHQMGNSFYHDFVYDALLAHGGVVTLHDFHLAGFHWWRAHHRGDPWGIFRAEVAFGEPDRFAEIGPQLDAWAGEPGGMQSAFTRRRIALNRRVFDRAEAVIVHSPWCRAQAGAMFEDRTSVVPMGARVRDVSEAERMATRARYGLPAGALLLGSFGHLTRGKMNVEAIEAFAKVAGRYPSALMILAGKDWEGGEAQRAAAGLGLSDRVRFLGRVDDEAFADLIAATDIGLCLRRPPTFGETSAALVDLLRHGVPTIITDVDTFADYPDGVVRKVGWESENPEGLVEAIDALAGHPAYRARLGRSARNYVAGRHDWKAAGEGYAEVIERVAAGRRRHGRAVAIGA